MTYTHPPVSQYSFDPSGRASPMIHIQAYAVSKEKYIRIEALDLKMSELTIQLEKTGYLTGEEVNGTITFSVDNGMESNN